MPIAEITGQATRAPAGPANSLARRDAERMGDGAWVFGSGCCMRSPLLNRRCRTGAISSARSTRRLHPPIVELELFI
jgi:hypothetical protein